MKTQFFIITFVALLTWFIPTAIADQNTVPAGWPYFEKDLAWVNSLSPMAGALLVNDRPTMYPKCNSKSLSDAEQQLRATLKLAEAEQAIEPSPALLLQAQCNLAALCYRQKNYSEASDLFERALAIQTKAGATNSGEYIDLLDCTALTFRAKRDFAAANKYLLTALDTRRKLFGPTSSEVAVGYVKLALAAHDANDADSVVSREKQALGIIGDSAFVSRMLSPNAERPHASCGSMRPKDWLPDMVAAAKQLASDLQERDVRRTQQRLAADEAERKRQEAIQQQQKSKQDEADRKRRAAIAALNKKNGEDVYGADDPPFAKITGQILYPLPKDAKVKFLITEWTPKNTKTEAKEGETKVEMLPIELAICKTGVQNAIATMLANYAQDNDQVLEEFGTTWPPTKIVADPLMQNIADVVTRNKIPKENWTTKGNDIGEYEFDGIPKGNYCVYAQLSYKQECLYWLVPLQVKDRRQIRLDLLKDNVSHYVWRQVHGFAAKPQ